MSVDQARADAAACAALGCTFTASPRKQVFWAPGVHAAYATALEDVLKDVPDEVLQRHIADLTKTLQGTWDLGRHHGSKFNK